MSKEEAPGGNDEPVPIEEGAVAEEGVDEPPYTPVVEPVAPESGEPEPVRPEPVKPEPVAPDPVAPDPVAPNPVKPDPPVVAEGGLAGLEDVGESNDLEPGFEHAPRARAEAMTKGRANDLSFIFVLSLRVRRRGRRAKDNVSDNPLYTKNGYRPSEETSFSCQRQKSV